MEDLDRAGDLTVKYASGLSNYRIVDRAGVGAPSARHTGKLTWEVEHALKLPVARAVRFIAAANGSVQARAIPRTSSMTDTALKAGA